MGSCAPLSHCRRFTTPAPQDDVNKDSYRPHSSRAVRLAGGRHGTVLWRISCVLSRGEEHLWTFLCLLLQGRRVPDARLEDIHFNPWFSSGHPFVYYQTTYGRAFVMG